MKKKFKLVGIESNKVYFESNQHADLQRWLDNEFSVTQQRSKGKKPIQRRPLPEAMKIVERIKKVDGKVNELLEYGFEYNELLEGLSLPISEKGKNFRIQLLIYLKNLDRVTIYQFKLGKGLQCILEETVLTNEDELFSSTKQNYLKFKESFPTIQAASPNENY